ncbi:SDR family NAD(P)-dependent oxidoreductase [Sphingosinicella sp. BN140058]|uniref:SDR family NAD(P)-dependent oxidoreductase n=1 Tax=Sphingosinicella sp. BN140058 TaxID=1892855 RepID=UPI001011CD4B|nr:SDR family NAD(P)-dependent oxidoreductase [Sphingosinicella sp. BN140058]QAY78378.1 SDR family NAD(P)-dependent oxidoreductase [Sphingosinicella sp. BN140058]
MSLHPAIAPGRIAVVTGAASGIGRAAALRFGAAGMRVVLADLDESALAAAGDDLQRQGIEARIVPTDVSDPGAVAHLKSEADRFGPVSLLMNNAGREGGGGILAGHEVWERTVATNLLGPLYGIQAFLPDLLEADWPCAVVNTGSKQGITLPPGDTAYNVSKAGLKAMTESLAHDLRATGGRVTAHLLIPGFTYTGFTRARGIAEKPAGAWTAEQVVDFLLPAMARGDFYILCPDNEVTREMDEKRIAWTAGDIVENRSALSRWDPRYADAFKAYMEGKGA